MLILCRFCAAFSASPPLSVDIIPDETACRAFVVNGRIEFAKASPPVVSPKFNRKAGVKATPKSERWAEVFRTYDSDGSGFIDQSELAAMLAELGVLDGVDANKAAAQLEADFAVIDVNGDGQVSLEEFNVYVKNMSRLQRHRLFGAANARSVPPELAEMEGLKEMHDEFCRCARSQRLQTI